MSPPSKKKRIAIFSRYNLADQYDLAAEFKDMLTILGRRNEVLHLSFRGPQITENIPEGVQLNELPLHFARASSRSILLNSILMYLYLPLAAWRLRRFRPDVIFLSEILPLVGLFFRYICRTRVATAYGDWHFHNMLTGKPGSRFLLQIVEKMDRFEVRRLSGFFCRATTAGERVQQWGIPAEAMRVVNDAPDPHAFYPHDATDLRKKCGFKNDDIVLMYHGVMHSGKGLDLLIKWSDQLYHQDKRIGLILVGGGPEETALRKMAATLPMKNRILFSGWLPTVQDVGHYCNAADICIAMRTRAEANERIVPGALLHSMACRKVVIGPRLSGVAEILREGDNGFMFTPDDGDDFQRLISYLATNRDIWPDVSERAYQDILQNYSVESAAKKYAEALEAFAQI